MESDEMNSEPKQQLRSPIEYGVAVRQLPSRGIHVPFEADAELCAALVRYTGVESVLEFSVQCEVLPWKKDGARVRGEIAARISQLCVVTLEPVESAINEPFDALYVPEGSKLSRPRVDKDGEMIIDAEGDDLPETFSGSELELGSIWTEFFTLAIDPFPRVQGVELPADISAQSAVADEESPFAVLSALKNSKLH